MNPTPDPHADSCLAELADLGMRAARVVVRLMEVEAQAAEIAATWLPTPAPAETLTDATTAGQAVDAVTAAMAAAVPRTEALARALDRIGRGVRRSLALRRRLATAWPGNPRTNDDRPALLRRQVARAVGDAIRREADGEAAERLFDELAEHLDTDDLQLFPVEQVVRRICRDLGLAMATLATPPSPSVDDTG